MIVKIQVQRKTQVANLCLMAQEVISKSSLKNNDFQSTFIDLLVEFKKIGMINNDLKRLNLELSNERDTVLKKNEDALQENQILKNELQKLKLFVKRFSYSEKLQLSLNNLKAIFNKTSLGFKTQRK